MPQIFEVPIKIDEPSFIIRTVLEGVTLILRFDWNDRSERWSLSIFDELERPLLLGLALEIDHELIRRFEIPGLPPGGLLLLDTSVPTPGTPAGRNDLGKRCVLQYQTSV